MDPRDGIKIYTVYIINVRNNILAIINDVLYISGIIKEILLIICIYSEYIYTDNICVCLWIHLTLKIIFTV